MEEKLNQLIIKAYHAGLTEILIAEIADLTISELQERLKKLGLKK